MYVAADVDAVTDRDVFGHGVPPRAHFGGVLKDRNDLCRPNSPGCVEVVCLRFIKHGKGVRKRPKGLFHYKLFVIHYSLFIEPHVSEAFLSYPYKKDFFRRNCVRDLNPRN